MESEIGGVEDERQIERERENKKMSETERERERVIDIGT